MISAKEAEQKIYQINPKTSTKTGELLLSILRCHGQLGSGFTQTESFRKPEYKDLVQWIESRLAQPHLGYLAPNQVNGLWGGSTTEALIDLGKRFGLGVAQDDPRIGQNLLTAILDGSKSNEPVIDAQPNTYEWFKQVYAKLGHEFREKTNHFNVCGIRGYLMPHGAVRNFGDKWNDTIFLIWIDATGKKRVEPFVASTDAGLYYYSIAPVPGGCAHLIEGQWIMEPGPHNGIPAFIQAGPVTVARTNTPDYDESSPRTTDNYPSNPYWINLHMGWEYGYESVYNSSAGCQVIKSAGQTGWQWQQFYSLLIQNKTLKFLYTLINSQTLKRIAA